MTSPFSSLAFDLQEALPAIAFVSDRIDDLAGLLAALPEGLEVVLLDGDRDGLAQMADALQGRSGLAAIHVLSHGTAGRVELGSAWLDAAGVAPRADVLAAIGGALRPDGDLLLYGCNAGAGDGGTALLSELARVTHADVAASTDATGSARLGGNWTLETSVGAIDDQWALPAATLEGFSSLLSVSDQNFDSAGLITAVNATSQAVGTWTFSAASAVDMAVANSNETVALLGGASDRVFIWNLDLNDGVANVSQFSFAATDGTNFDLNSFSLAASSNDGYGTYAQTMSVSISGWRDGAQVVAGETVDLRTSDSAGNITYTVAGTGTDNNGFQDFFHGYGQLSFGSAFDSVDEIRLAFGGTVTAEVDDIDITVASAAAISSATYNASTGVLSVTGSGMTTGDTIDPTKLTVTGSNGGTYTLTSGSVTASSATAFSITLNAADRVAVNGLWNYDGTTAVNGTTYNLSAASGWNATASALADTTNGVTVSSVATPTITSATYDASTNVLVVTGTRMVGQPGSANDITVSNLRLRGEGGTSYTLTSSNVDVSSETSFSVTLNGTDAAAVELLFNRNGTTSTDISTYTLSALDYWNTDVNDGGMADSNNVVTVSNVPVPAITSATYDASTGALVVTGTGFTVRSGAANDIDVSKLTLSGEGGATHTLTTGNVEITNGTSFSVTLNSTDQAAVGLFINKNGTSSIGGSTYNLAAAEDWALGASSAVVVADLTGNGITASNVPIRPTATVVVSDTALSVGETSLATFTFSEAVTGFSNADLTVPNGTLSSVSSSDGGTTWTATFTPTAGVTDATNVITLDMTGVSSVGTSTAGSGTTDSNNFAIDTVRPTATIGISDTALKIGDTALVTVTFSEAVSGFTNADLDVANGTLSAVSTSDGGVTWTATLTPSASTIDATNIITLDNTGVTDLAGNAGTGSTNSSNYAIDTVRPTASVVVADTALRIGETSGVTFTFSEAVAGFTTADLTVDNGTVSSLSSSDGGITWTATFTPTASITNANNVITLDNTGVTDFSGNAGTGSTDSNNYAIDTARPTASVVVADSALRIGETSGVTFTFTEAVSGFTNADLLVANGTLSAVSTSDGGVTWTATLTPTASITDATNVITLDNTGVADAAGNTGSGSTDSNNYAIDTVRPTASLVVADTALRIGETSAVTITFSEAVTGFTNADLTVANGTLSAVSSSDGGVTWTATLTPTAATTDATNLITLDNTGVADTAGNAGSGSTDSDNYAIDTVRPTATIVVADNALTGGETSLVTFTFSEAASGFTNADLSVANGTLSSVSSSDGGVTWTATLTPNSSVLDATNLITMDNTGVTDAAGNAGSGTTDSNNYAINTSDTEAPVFASAVATGASLVLSFTDASPLDAVNLASAGAFTVTSHGNPVAVTGVSVDGTARTVTLTLASPVDYGRVVTVAYTDPSGGNDAQALQDTVGNDAASFGPVVATNNTADPTPLTASLALSDAIIGIGETATLDIVFSEPVSAFDLGDLNAPNGSLTGLSSTDAVHWTAVFTPTPGADAASNLATLDLTALLDVEGLAGSGTATSAPYAVDTTRPTAEVVVDDNAVGMGETARVSITFSEAVNDFGLGELRASSGVLSDLVTSDNIRWTALYTPQPNTRADAERVEVELQGVRDTAGNTGAGTAQSASFAVDTRVPDTTPPALASAQVSGSRLVLDFGAAELLDAAHAPAAGAFSVSVGGATRPVSAVAVSGGQVILTLAQPVLPGESIRIAYTDPSTGDDPQAIQDQAGNDAMGFNAVVVRNDTPPSVSATLSVDDTVLALAETTTLTIRFSSAVTGFDLADLAAPNATLDNLSSPDGATWTARLTPAAGLQAASNAVVLNLAGLSDLQGSAGTGSATSNAYAVDTVAPLLDGVASNPPTGAQQVPVGQALVLQFSEQLATLAGGAGGAGVRLLLAANGAPVAATASVDGSGRLVIVPAAPLLHDTAYAVTWEAGALRDLAGNQAVAGADHVFRTAPSPDAVTTSSIVDGTQVQTRTTPEADGSTSIIVAVPPVPVSRTEDPTTPNTALADVPLGQGTPGHAPPLLASLPSGMGLLAQGRSTVIEEPDSVSSVIQGLLPADTGQTPALANGLIEFSSSVEAGQRLEAQRLTLTPTPTSSDVPVELSRPLNADGNSINALVLDARQLPAGSSVIVNEVAFTVVLGEVTMTGGAGPNIAIGDGSRQIMVLGADDDLLRGGGGDDIVGSKGGNDRLYGDEGDDLVVGGTGDDALDGGSGNDVLQGGRSDAGTWTIRIDGQGRLESTFAAAQPVLGGPDSVSITGPWAAAGTDSDDRLAYSFQDPQRLKTVALLYHGATGQLPSLEELNSFSSAMLDDLALAQLAVDHLLVRRGLQDAPVEQRVQAVIEAAWGAGSASAAWVAEGVRYIDAGGRWADGLLALVGMEAGQARLLDEAGRLNLAQPYRTGELGWDSDSSHDVLRGGDGDDRLVGGRGNDLLDGGAGLDTAVFLGSVDDYRLTKANVDGVVQWQMQTIAGTEVDTLVGIERWEIGSHTYAASPALANLSDGVSLPLADLVVELVGIGSTAEG